MWLLRRTQLHIEIMAPPMPESDNKAKQPDLNLHVTQDLDYHFFVHNVSQLEYQFTHPSHAAATPALPVGVPSSLSYVDAMLARPVTDKLITDRCGAVITYPLWQILPASIKYANGTLVSFEYDTNGDVTRIMEVPGTEWRRGEATQNDFYKWSRSDGKTYILKVTVLPDGNYLMLHETGLVHQYTTEGKLMVGRPFAPKFDLQQSLVRVFKQLDKGGDGLLTKAELNAGVSFHWKHEDDAQLVTMLKMHFELIQIFRDKPLFKLGKGISMDDVQHYDSQMRSRYSTSPSAESMKTIEGIFALIDTDHDQNVSVREIQEKPIQEKLSPGQKASLNYLITHTNKLHTFTSRGYVNRAERMTKNEFLAHYAEIYRDEVGKYANAGGWGIEKKWRQTMEAKRTLYADEAVPLKSLNVEAIKQGAVGDCLFLSALASVISVRPNVIVDSIAENENDTYTVTFAGAKDVPIAVAAPTSAELTLYAKGSVHGIWAPLMEKAYGMLVAKRRNLPAVIPAENTATRENMKSLDTLTGNPSRWEYTQDSCTRALGNCRRTLTENELRSLLTRSFRNRRAIVAAALKTTEPERGEPLIVGMHAYSVIGWDVQKDEVVLRNPWGVVPLNATHMDLFQFQPGKRLDDDGSQGIFKLALISFYRKFEALCIETPNEDMT